jgi:uncharacterized membrane protein YhaH (DUF805 family)
MSVPGTHPPAQYPPGGFLPAPLTYLEGASVDFGVAVEQALRNGFVYRGRASRSAFWWFAVFQGLVSLALQLIVVIPQAASNGGSGVGTVITLIIFIIFIPAAIYLELVGLALLVRRLHDIDRSAWWLLICLVPIVGAIALLVFTLLAGTPAPNRYQPSASGFSGEPGAFNRCAQ